MIVILLGVSICVCVCACVCDTLKDYRNAEVICVWFCGSAVVCAGGVDGGGAPSGGVLVVGDGGIRFQCLYQFNVYIQGVISEMYLLADQYWSCTDMTLRSVTVSVRCPI